MEENKQTDKVKKSDIIKFLGVWIDLSLTMKLGTMKCQIMEVCKKANTILHVIWRIRIYLRITCQRLVGALVVSKLDYANAIYPCRSTSKYLKTITAVSKLCCKGHQASQKS